MPRFGPPPAHPPVARWRELRRAMRGAVPAALLGVLVCAAPAVAHGGDPTLATVLDSVSPPLPADVVVQVRTTVSEQVLVANPTRTSLEIEDPGGRPFLRISAAGVFADAADPFFHQSLNPPDSPARLPAFAGVDAKPRWGLLSKGSSWGWFDPRLHPLMPAAQPTAPPRRPDGSIILATWTIAMRYGEQAVTAAGVLERRAVLGGFLATLDPPPRGLTVSIGQGPVPALLLRAPPDIPVTVQGVDGLPFLRLDGTGAYANPRSRSFPETPTFADDPRQADGWARVGEAGSVTWVDPRLTYRADRPPEVVVRAERRAELGRWRIPVTVGGRNGTLTGTIEWVPAKDTRALIRGGGGGVPAWTWPTVVLAVVVAVALGIRARSSAAASPAEGRESSDLC